jgi:putative SOS response-associated peptidase YedK
VPVARGRLADMCGRYASDASRSELLEQFVVDEKYSDELRGQDFNVTPTKDNPVVIARVPDDAARTRIRCASCELPLGPLPNLRISEGKHAPTGW